MARWQNHAEIIYAHAYGGRESAPHRRDTLEQRASLFNLMRHACVECSAFAPRRLWISMWWESWRPQDTLFYRILRLFAWLPQILHVGLQCEARAFRLCFSMHLSHVGREGSGACYDKKMMCVLS